ncbi:MAG: TIGR03936 family radical SAM-associated protein [Bellilinea sp.]
MMRFRITYQKTEALRYTGNLDLQKIWERFLRRAELPVAYSQGFHPQARIQQACPLPLGFLALNEQLDIYLDNDQAAPATIIAQLQAAPYPGISILQVDFIDPAEPALSTQVVSSDYRVEFLDPQDIADLKSRVANVLEAGKIIRSRRGKEYDLRPLIEELSLIAGPNSDTPALFLRLSARQSATGRPEEVVSALGYDPFSARYVRTRLILSTEKQPA